MAIPVGISACVMGQKVRYDGGHKRSLFVVEELSKYIDFKPVCPEVGIGMTIPRPTIHLMTINEDIRLVATKDATQDYTKKMVEFTDAKIQGFQDLRGYIVCAKSPTCGMERVKLYLENGNTVPGGSVGIFTKRLQESMPWLPIEEDGRLNDPVLRENFVFRVYVLDDLYHSFKDGMSADKFIKFHSRYKLCLMAYDPIAYRSLGRFVANIGKWQDLSLFFIEYRQRLMDVFKKRSSRKNNTNVLMHIQGYFKRDLDKKEKAELRDVIMRYRNGLLPLVAPLTLINNHLKIHPDLYLKQQAYLEPYPEDLKLRMTL